MSRAARLEPASRTADGATPGSIMAAIIGTHTDTKRGKDPSVVPTPISIALIRGTVTAQPTTPSPTVATRALATGGAMAADFTICAVLVFGSVVISCSVPSLPHDRLRPAP